VTPALFAVLGALGLAVLYVRAERLPRLAALAAVAVGTAGLAVWRVGGHKLEHAVTRHPALAGAGLVAGIVAAVVGTWLLLRWPWLLAFAALVAAPVRVPLHIGDQQAFLLVLLYLVIGCAWCSLVWELLRGREQRPLGRALGLPLAAYLLISGASLWWSADTLQGVTTYLFFFLPFGLLAAAVGRLRPQERLLRLLGIELLVVALACALLGIAQAVVHRTAWHNPKLEISNTYAPFFRVNSIFYDPSVYGRFLAVAIVVAVAAIVLDGMRPIALAALSGVLWIGLALSYSQSSLVALAAGLIACAALVWRRQVLLGVAAAAVLLALAVLVAPPFSTFRHDVAHGNFSKVTSDRSTLAGTGLRLFGDNPLDGVGLGGFLQAAQPKHNANARGAKGASHIAPLTIAAETGILGLAAFVWVIAALARLGLAPPGSPQRLQRLVLGLGLLTILVHSLFYAAFFEDPLTWLLAALLVVATRGAAQPAETRPGMIRAA
jgi:O-antigen ligase